MHLPAMEKEDMESAKVIARAVFRARQGAAKSEIRAWLDGCLALPDSRTDAVRTAIDGFLASGSFEDAVRKAAISGGAAAGALAGAVAEAYYGVPDEWKDKALAYLSVEERAIVDDWYAFRPANPEEFRMLTKYLGKFSGAAPARKGGARYSGLAAEFAQEMYRFIDDHPEYGLTEYIGVLERNGLRWDDDGMRAADPALLDAQGVLALLTGAVLSGRFSEDTLAKCLKRLKEID